MEPTTDRPLLSVVMPVHNGVPFLDESINSILNQTLTDFEFVILDDASTDGSARVLREWERRDGRIRVISSERRLGLSGSSNLVVSEATAPPLARMDADDISHPDRLRRQWAIIKGHPDIVAVGTLCDGINADGQRIRPRDRWRLVRHSRYVPFPHGSVMFRRKAFEAVNGYSEDLLTDEDLDFFFKMTRIGRVVTLPDVLYRFRYHVNNTTLRTSAQRLAPVQANHNGNDNALAELYMLGAMRLWAGQPPGILTDIIAGETLHWNLASLKVLGSASLGTISPKTLRFLLRLLTRARDCLAGMQVRDGTAYEWRTK